MMMMIYCRLKSVFSSNAKIGTIEKNMELASCNFVSGVVVLNILEGSVWNIVCLTMIVSQTSLNSFN